MSEIELFAENELTITESEELSFHEKVVDDVQCGIEKLASIGDASLKVLRDKRLYRTTHKTFEDYCQERFGFTCRRINQKIGFAAMLEDLGTRVPTLPATERQARPLTALPTPELQAQAWEQAQADSGKEQPSNREVAEAVAKVQAELESERQARLTAEQCSEDWRTQAMKDRDEKRAAEQKVLTLESQPKPKPEVIEKEVVPADYESAKQQAATLQAQTETLQKQLATLQKQQDKIINDQVKTKLQGYQEELNKLEADKRVIEDIVARKKAYLDSLDSEVKRIETHQDVINGVRLELIGLAGFLNDMEPMNDPATIRKWLALADMHEEAMNAIRMVFGKPRLELAA